MQRNKHFGGKERSLGCLKTTCHYFQQLCLQVHVQVASAWREIALSESPLLLHNEYLLNTYAF